MLAAEGRLQELAGDRAAAIASYTEAAKADSQCSQCWLALGRLHAADKKWKGAEKAWAKVLRLDPENQQLRLRLAECYLAQEKQTWAIRTLKPLAQSTDEETTTRYKYLMGIAALQSDDPETAIESFEASGSGALSPMQKFHLGRAYLMKNESKAAWRNLAAFLADPLRDSRYDAAAQMLVEATYAQSVHDPLASIGLSVRPLYDSNVVQEPDDLPTTGGKSPSSFGMSLIGNLTINAWRASRHLLGVDLVLLRTFYFEDPANDFSYTGGSLVPRYRHRFNAFGRYQEFNIGYRGQLGMLDGGSLAEEDDFYVYNESHGGWLRWVIHEDSFGDTSVNGGFARTMYHLMGRDNWKGSGSIGQAFFFSDETFKLFLEVHGRYESAQRNDYTRWGIGPFVGLSALLPLKLSALFWLRYEYLDHPDSDDTIVWEGSRTDHQMRIALQVTRSFWDALDIGLAYDATRTESSLDIFTYSRHTISLIVGGRYAWH